MKKILSQLEQARLIHSIHLCLGSDERLLQFLFHHKEPRLREASAVLLYEAKTELSSAENILIQCAMDLWSAEGCAKFSEVIGISGENNFLNLIRALLYSRGFEDYEWPYFLSEPC
jgi:hypothetical protein